MIELFSCTVRKFTNSNYSVAKSVTKAIEISKGTRSIAVSASSERILVGASSQFLLWELQVISMQKIV